MVTLPFFTDGRLSSDDFIALHALCVEYAWRIDYGESAQIPELFTPDGMWDGPWGLLKGKTDLERGWLERSRKTVQTRHLTTNMRFLAVGSRLARGWNSFLVFMGEPGTPVSLIPQFVSDNFDEYERQSDGKWLFRSRRVTQCFSNSDRNASNVSL